MKERELSRYLKNNDGIFFENLFSAESLADVTVANLDFVSCGFAIDFDLSDSKFEQLDFSECQFSKSSWTKVNIKNCKFVNCTFESATWKDIDFEGCHFYGCEFHNANFNDLSFVDCFVRGVHFIGPCELSGKLDYTRWFDVTWPETKLNWTLVSDCHFYQVDMSGKPFPWQNIGPSALLDKCKMGEFSFKDLKVTNVTLSGCEFDLLDLTNATLTNVNFGGSTMKQVQAEGFKGEDLKMGKTNIESGNFKNMNISVSSTFWEADLKDCDFSNSKMGIAVFEKAKLEAVNFANAEFKGCNLSDAHLNQVSFKEAKVNNLNLSDTLMDEVEGLKG